MRIFLILSLFLGFQLRAADEPQSPPQPEITSQIDFEGGLLNQLLVNQWDFVSQRGTEITFCYGEVRVNLNNLASNLRDQFYEILQTGRLTLSDGKVFDVSGVRWAILGLNHRRLNSSKFDAYTQSESEVEIIVRQKIEILREMHQKRYHLTAESIGRQPHHVDPLAPGSQELQPVSEDEMEAIRCGKLLLN